MVFPSKKVFVEEVLLALVEKALVTYVQLALASYMSTTCNFDLWMFVGTYDMFVVIANFFLANESLSMWQLVYLRSLPLMV